MRPGQGDRQEDRHRSQIKPDDVQGSDKQLRNRRKTVMIPVITRQDGIDLHAKHPNRLEVEHAYVDQPFLDGPVDDHGYDNDGVQPGPSATDQSANAGEQNYGDENWWTGEGEEYPSR